LVIFGRTGGIGTLSFGLSFGLASKSDRSVAAIDYNKVKAQSGFCHAILESGDLLGFFQDASPELLIKTCLRMGCHLGQQSHRHNPSSLDQLNLSGFTHKPMNLYDYGGI
jgi:hypothetical protein